jgi:hypothetical protein
MITDNNIGGFGGPLQRGGNYDIKMPVLQRGCKGLGLGSALRTQAYVGAAGVAALGLYSVCPWRVTYRCISGLLYISV